MESNSLKTADGLLRWKGDIITGYNIFYDCVVNFDIQDIEKSCKENPLKCLKIAGFGIDNLSSLIIKLEVYMVEKIKCFGKNKRKICFHFSLSNNCNSTNVLSTLKKVTINNIYDKEFNDSKNKNFFTVPFNVCENRDSISLNLEIQQNKIIDLAKKDFIKQISINKKDSKYVKICDNYDYMFHNIYWCA